MNIIAITMVYNEGDTLRRWLRHYGNQFGPKNLLVLDHGSDDGSTADLGQSGRINLPRSVYDDNQRAAFITNLQKDLFGYYDAVVYSDCDELIVADPRKYNGLADYIQKMEGEVARPVGFNVFQDVIPGTPLERDRTISEQRDYAIFRVGMCKPLVARAPVRWVPGFHSCDKRVSIDPSLYLFHTKDADFQASLRRLGVTRNLPWSERSLAGRQGAHQRRSDDEWIRTNFEGPIAQLQRDGVRDFTFDDVVQTYDSKLEKKGAMWICPGFPGGIYRVPDWLRGAF